MQQILRIAVFRPLGEELASMLRRLSPRPEVRILDSLYTAATELLEFRPQLAMLSGNALVEADIGGLRLLQATLGELSLLLVVPPTQEVELTLLARRLHARMLIEPLDLRQLAALVRDPGMASEPSNPEFFVDLARGLGDAINNPLMFASGHLQLLELRHCEAEDRQQILAIRQALDEIAACVEKVRSLADDGGGRQVLILRSLLEEALSSVPAEIEIDAPAELDRAAVWGNREQLTVAFREFLAMAMELGERRSLALRCRDQLLQVELHLQGEFARGWQLPRSFEPYYLTRILRGSKHGLALFLVQAIIHAHGGTATASKPDPHSLTLVLTLHHA